MFVSRKVGVLIFTVAFMSFGTRCKSPNQSIQIVSNLPLGTAINIIHILTSGDLPIKESFSDGVNASSVEYWLFTRENPDNPEIINSTDEINPNKPVKILIHGWMGNADVHYINVIKNAYLKRYDGNVISVDYSKYADGDYLTAYTNAFAVGITVAEFVCNMSSRISPDLIHVVGHSLGAQVAGIAGDQVKQQCKATIGRITGLDPAGPLFQNTEEPYRLDSKDALLVDVIHTNQGQFGYTGRCGTVDFYPNCGYDQPGCVSLRKSRVTLAVEEVFLLSITNVFCSHHRSNYLFAESINNNSFYSSTCFSCKSQHCFLEGTNEMYSSSTAYMGESCNSAPKDSEYILYTNRKSPYARGPPGPLN